MKSNSMSPDRKCQTAVWYFPPVEPGAALRFPPYLCEGDGDAGIQLDVIRQLGELVLLLLKRLQQTVDLLLGEHHPAVVLHRGGGRQTWTR